MSYKYIEQTLSSGSLWSSVSKMKLFIKMLWEKRKEKILWKGKFWFLKAKSLFPTMTHGPALATANEEKVVWTIVVGGWVDKSKPVHRSSFNTRIF